MRRRRHHGTACLARCRGLNTLGAHGSQQEYTPLHLAVISENVHMVKMLLERSIEVQKTIDLTFGDTGSTALHWAATKGNVELVAALQGSLANKNLKDVVRMRPTLRGSSAGSVPTMIPD
jgi:26S proteasome non-ATPase regulatory subunit 10